MKAFDIDATMRRTNKAILLGIANEQNIELSRGHAASLNANLSLSGKRGIKRDNKCRIVSGKVVYLPRWYARPRV